MSDFITFRELENLPGIFQVMDGKKVAGCIMKRNINDSFLFWPENEAPFSQHVLEMILGKVRELNGKPAD